MTCIAANRQLMAADTKVTDGDRFYYNKKIHVVGETIVGMAGEVDDCCLFFDWYRAGRQTPGPRMRVKSDVTFEALVLTRDGLYSFSACTSPDKLIDRFYAIGTGAQAAMAVMHMGKSPSEGVAMAKRIDPGTGGPVQILRLKDIR